MFILFLKAIKKKNSFYNKKKNIYKLKCLLYDLIFFLVLRCWMLYARILNHFIIDFTMKITSKFTNKNKTGN